MQWNCNTTCVVFDRLSFSCGSFYEYIADEDWIRALEHARSVICEWIVSSGMTLIVTWCHVTWYWQLTEVCQRTNVSHLYSDKSCIKLPSQASAEWLGWLLDYIKYWRALLSNPPQLSLDQHYAMLCCSWLFINLKTMLRVQLFLQYSLITLNSQWPISSNDTKSSLITWHLEY